MADHQPLRETFRHGDTDIVTSFAQAQLAQSRANGDPAGEVEALYALARVALREHDLDRSADLAHEALAVAEASGDGRLEERPRHVLAAVARMSGDYAHARDLYQASIERNLALGNEHHVHSEYHNLALTELHLGNIERAREMFAESQARVVRSGLGEFVPYLGLAGVAIAAAEGDMGRAARLIGFTEEAFAAIDQVPDPDDARDLDELRRLTVSALGQDRYSADREAGARWSCSQAFGRS
jgi:tetratricopeptide (TPR) repeat protein